MPSSEGSGSSAKEGWKERDRSSSRSFSRQRALSTTVPSSDTAGRDKGSQDSKCRQTVPGSSWGLHTENQAEESGGSRAGSMASKEHQTRRNFCHPADPQHPPRVLRYERLVNPVLLTNERLELGLRG